MKSALTPYLVRFSRRLRLRDGLHFAQFTLPFAGITALLILVIGRLLPIENLLFYALLPPLLWLIASIGYTLFHRLPLLQVAARLDVELGLKERLSSSLAIANHPLQNNHSESYSTLLAALHQNALQAAQGIDPSHDLPLPFFRRRVLLTALEAALAAALIFAPNPMQDILIERQAIARQAQQQAQQIDRLRDQIQRNQAMTPQQRDELLRKLDELSRQLRENRGDLKQALADLSRLEDALQAKIDPKAAQRQATEQAIGDQLRALANSSSDSSLQATQEALQKLADQMKDMSPEARQALAQQLAQLAARAAQAGDNQLAQALSGMSQAAQSGDAQQAQQSAQAAAQALQQSQSQQANQQALNQALTQAQSSRQALAQSGKQAGQQAGGSQQQAQSGQQGQAGQGQSGQSQQGQGQPGQGQNGQSQPGQGGNQPGSGGGTTASQLPPGRRTGSATTPRGAGQAGSVTPLDKVYAPRATGSKGTGQMNVTGQDTSQGQTTTSQQNDPAGGLNNPSLVPYQDVYQEYFNSASQAIDQSSVPPEMKDYVKSYFSQLQPAP